MNNKLEKFIKDLDSSNFNYLLDLLTKNYQNLNEKELEHIKILDPLP